MKDNVLLNKDTMNETSNAPPAQLTAEWCLQNSGIQWNPQYLPSTNELLASEKEMLQKALETESISPLLSVSYSKMLLKFFSRKD